MIHLCINKICAETAWAGPDLRGYNTRECGWRVYVCLLDKAQSLYTALDCGSPRFEIELADSGLQMLKLRFLLSEQD